MDSALLTECRASLIKSIRHLIEAPLEGHGAGKIIHDPIWGTCRLEPWEAALLDVPLFQRLRGIKQTGFAHFTYPSAEHSRFQHTLGVVNAASKIVESLSTRYNEDAVFRKDSQSDFSWLKPGKEFDKIRAMVRLAAFVHDLGHSFYSHSSERFYEMIQPFPELRNELKRAKAKRPGAAEVVVYLLVTSEEWRSTLNEIFEKCRKRNPALELPTLGREEWETIGNWVMGYEPDVRRGILADIVSGPLDADKLDYIARDAYFSGIPVGHDFERYISLVCIDYQETAWRLTLPFKAINALEQLVMARLALTSYLYHHQKVRAAEIVFERLLARASLLSKGKEFLSFPTVWDLFASEDADVYAHAHKAGGQWLGLLQRNLPVRYLEFRERDVVDADSTRTGQSFLELSQWTNSGSLEKYERLLALEADIAVDLAKAHKMDTQTADQYGLTRENPGVYIDIPRSPNYDDLGNLKLPARHIEENHLVHKDTIYKAWINAYKTNRSYVRVFAQKGLDHRAVFSVVHEHFKRALGIQLQESNCVPR